MLESVMTWNEPNNKSHWDLEADAGWPAVVEGVDGIDEADRPALIGHQQPITCIGIGVLTVEGLLQDGDAFPDTFPGDLVLL